MKPFCGTTEIYLSLGKYKYIMAVPVVIANLQNLTLPNQFSIPFPNPVGGTNPSPTRGHLNPNSDTFEN